MSSRSQDRQSASQRKPEFLLNTDDQVAWVPVRSQRFDLETRNLVQCEITRGKAKHQAIHEITSNYDWNSLRCTKVWMVWDDEFTDRETGWRGCWVEAKKTAVGAEPYWRVEEMRKVLA